MLSPSACILWFGMTEDTFLADFPLPYITPARTQHPHRHPNFHVPLLYSMSACKKKVKNHFLVTKSLVFYCIPYVVVMASYSDYVTSAASDKTNRIYHHTVGGARESHPSVHDLQSTTRLAESWMLQIMDTSAKFGYRYVSSGRISFLVAALGDYRKQVCARTLSDNCIICRQDFSLRGAGERFV